jgi:hypothetical protein
MGRVSLPMDATARRTEKGPLRLTLVLENLFRFFVLWHPSEWRSEGGNHEVFQFTRDFLPITVINNRVCICKTHGQASSGIL